MGFGMSELLIVLIIVALLFGTKKLSNLGSDLGTAIKGFKNAVTDEHKTKNQTTQDSATHSDDTKSD